MRVESGDAGGPVLPGVPLESCGRGVFLVLLGVPLERLNLKENLLLACINRNGTIIMPRGQDTLEAGDTVIVVTTHTGLNDLKDILR